MASTTQDVTPTAGASPSATSATAGDSSAGFFGIKIPTSLPTSIPSGWRRGDVQDDADTAGLTGGGGAGGGNSAAAAGATSPTHGGESTGGWLEDVFPDLDWTTRLQGFVFFVALGLIANLLSWMSLSTGHITKYAVLTTLGNVMSLGATSMFVGPARQCRMMFDETRKVAAMAYLASLVGTAIAGILHALAVIALGLVLADG